MASIANKHQTPPTKRARTSNAASTSVETPVPVPLVRRTQMLKIRLATFTARKAGLLNLDIIKVDNYEWVTDISDTADYLFYIVSLVLSVDRREVMLLIEPDGEWRDEASKTWIVVKKGDKIVSGVYLAGVRKGIFLVSLYYLFRMILTA
jgi:hypothetical protein